MRGACALLAGVMVFVMATPTADAGLRRWTARGPFGGRVQTLETHPTESAVILAGTHGGGIFRSTDGGHSWTRTIAGLPADTAIFDLEFAPSEPNIVYAATYSNGALHKSLDGGRSWTRAGSYPSGAAHSVAVSPVDPDDVWTVAGSSLYHSVDGAKTWTEVRPWDAPFDADEVVYSPADPDVMYVSGDGLRHSTDGGKTWKGTPYLTSASSSVVPHPHKPGVVYVGASNHVYKSTNFGTTFTSVLELPSILDTAISLAVNPARPGTVYTGTQYSGIYRITGGGTASGRWNRGVPALRVPAVAVPISGQTVLVGLEDHAVYRRDHDADRWRASRDGVLGSTVLDLATPPTGGDHVYAATYRQGVARSTDGGASWHWDGLYGKVVEDLAIHPSKRSVIYAAADQGLFKTVDGGKSWHRVRRLPDDAFMAVAFAPSSPRVVYAATFDSGVFRSGDGGRSWRRWSLPEYKVPFSLAVHPARPNTAFAGTRFAGVAKTTDGGKTWTSGTGLPSAYDSQDIEIDPRKPRRMYVAVDDGGLFRSLDGGATWRRMWRGENVYDAMAVEVDQRRPWRVFIAVGPWEDRPGVYRSSDYGRTWEAMNNGLSPRGTVALALSADGGKLHAGTEVFTGGGVFSYRFR